ncbi:hypothetical protein K461DRAFT_270596 [Myriangium duriaei CBS 260.36]|uniref:Uncharacterized protein n=1 Tax=Myriangium duriaei CBS 260.36 TaxID=1168546 RepID=A0A9P4IUT3_9PEZI|nr:hypothetical protein K461DRAFT_270596 [Myriangium duriaei CBS 260.36]
MASPVNSQSAYSSMTCKETIGSSEAPGSKHYTRGRCTTDGWGRLGRRPDAQIPVSDSEADVQLSPITTWLPSSNATGTNDLASTITLSASMPVPIDLSQISGPRISRNAEIDSPCPAMIDPILSSEAVEVSSSSVQDTRHLENDIEQIAEFLQQRADLRRGEKEQRRHRLFDRRTAELTELQTSNETVRERSKTLQMRCKRIRMDHDRLLVEYDKARGYNAGLQRLVAICSETDKEPYKLVNDCSQVVSQVEQGTWLGSQLQERLDTVRAPIIQRRQMLRSISSCPNHVSEAIPVRLLPEQLQITASSSTRKSRKTSCEVLILPLFDELEMLRNPWRLAPGL